MGRRASAAALTPTEASKFETTTFSCRLLYVLFRKVIIPRSSGCLIYGQSGRSATHVTPLLSSRSCAPQLFDTKATG